LTKTDTELACRDVAFVREYWHPRRIRDLANEDKWAKTALGEYEKRVALGIDEHRKSQENHRFEMSKHAKYVDGLRADMDQLTLKAPADGIVVHGDAMRRLADGGAPGMRECEQFKTGDGVGQNQIVMTLYDPQELAVMTAVPESQRHLVSPGQGASVNVNSTGKRLDGKLVFVADPADSMKDGQAMFSARVELTDAPAEVRPGFACTVQLVIKKESSVIVIPASLLVERDGRTFVSVIMRGATVERQVTVGGRNDTEAWIQSGLEQGDMLAPKN
jgi:hypothetical protein